MKININNINTIPKQFGIGFCVYGKPKDDIQEWINFWGFKTEDSKGFTNIFVNSSDIEDFFIPTPSFKYLDGFSPNLNKHLHIGHLSNLVIAKAIQNFGYAEKTIAILGDTLDGSIEKKDAFEKYKSYCKDFNYSVDDIYYASTQQLENNELLYDGEGEYKGTKVFNLDGNKIVGIKSSGSTTYFYQDVALATKLNSPTIYITGLEQIPHFNSLKKLFPHIQHIGLGLVLNSHSNKLIPKMSSSLGNVIWMQDVIDMLMNEFNDLELVYNIIAGQFLKYAPTSDKKINLKQFANVKTSHGLYISYTLAKLKSAGMKVELKEDFNTFHMKFKFMKAKYNFSPAIFFDELIDLCKTINQMYLKFHIKDHPENQLLYKPLMEDLELGMKKIGMFSINKV
jgi:hypothetical protein